jgi:DNA-binding XRE family transcriptional regulator
MNWKDFEKQLTKNPEFRKEAAKLEPEYQLARSLIGARIKKKMTQESLAKKAQTDQASISRLESCRSKPSLALLRKIATALDANLMIKFEI